MRYIGTKRWLSPVVRSAVVSLDTRGHVVDLFAGMGSVASAISPVRPVIANDILGFTVPFNYANLVRRPADLSPDQIFVVQKRFQRAKHELGASFSRRTAAEGRALQEGSKSLRQLMDTTPHPGTSRYYRRLVRTASTSRGTEAYRLAALYFGGGYFSTRQAIDLDALRYAIDTAGHDSDRHLLLAAWLNAAAAVMNSPGHSAQYLKPTSDSVTRRITSQWQRDIWCEFVAALADFSISGRRTASARNVISQLDALAFLKSPLSTRVAAVYADPPYTRHQYSRYYHVYETLFRYDYPGCRGKGRSRSDRHRSEFSQASRVAWAFNELASRVASLRVPLILSYPEDGLLCQRGIRPETILSAHFDTVTRIQIAAEHSTLAGSSEGNTKPTVEWLFIARPSSRTF
jgi:adenine-specific DNA-methyltransferase